MHFLILNRSGPGDANMSSLFQAGLSGQNFAKNPLEIAYGSVVTLKNSKRGGALLHSHKQTYPSGSGQQQITTYAHKDSNNNWIVDYQWGLEPYNDTQEIKFLQHGDIIRLVHQGTMKNLHSHQVEAPITKSQYEVSGYGLSPTEGDNFDHWIVERVDDYLHPKSSRIQILSTRFRLRHLMLNCLLREEGEKLPEWGFSQGEIVCQKKPASKSFNNMWNVEDHINPRRKLS